MIVASSFDLWQRDAFFSAAEEVQESADILESTYRTWVRERRVGLPSQEWDELCRELQTALGTAKWQLEEFDKAVRLSHRNHADNTTTMRHGQFVLAIENEISHVEAALRDYFNVNDNQPLQWVDLDEEECADLANFIAGTTRTLSSLNHPSVKPKTAAVDPLWKNQYRGNDASVNSYTGFGNGCMDDTGGLKTVPINIDSSHVIELETEEIGGTRDDVDSQNRNFGPKRSRASPSFGALKILIPGDDDQRETLRSRLEATVSPKEKGSKSAFWRWNHFWGDYTLSRGRLPRCFQLRGLIGCLRVFRQQVQGPQHLVFNCSVQVMLVLMLTMFLIVPFVLYSN